MIKNVAIVSLSQGIIGESFVKFETDIAVYDWIQLFRNSKDYMKVWCIQDILSAGIYPLFLREFLAHGTTPIPAGIIMDRNAATVFTYAYVYTKGTCLAIHDVISGFSLNCGKFMTFFIRRIKAIEHILNCAAVPHDSPPLGASKGLRMPRRVLLLTCRYTSVERGST